MIWNWFKKCDLFGRNIQIRFKNQRHHKTNFGGLVSLSLILAFVIFIIYQANDRYTPRTFIRNQVSVSPPVSFDLSTGILDFAFGIKNSNGDFIVDSSIYYIEASAVTYNRLLDSTTERQLAVDICNKDSFSIPSIKSSFMSLNYTNLYCFSPGQSLVLEGDLFTSTRSFLKFYVKKCDLSFVSTCADSTIIDAFFEDTTMKIYYSDNRISHTHDQIPFEVSMEEIEIPSGLPLMKDVRIKFQNTNQQDIGGVYNELLEESNHFTFNEYTSHVLPYRKGGGLYQVTIENSKSMESQIVRNFQPWSVFFSQLGGFYQVIIGIGCLICYPLSQIDLDLQLINALFNIDPSPENINSSPLSAALKVSPKKYSIEEKTATQTQQLVNEGLTQQKDPVGSEISHLQLDNESGSKVFSRNPNQELTLQPPHLFDQPLVSSHSQQQKPSPLEDFPLKKFSLSPPRKTSFTGAISSSPMFKGLHLVSKRTPSSNTGANQNVGTAGATGEQIINKIQKLKDNLEQTKMFRKFFNVNSVQFTLIKYIKLNLFCCKRQKQIHKRQLDKSVYQLYSHLDVYNILQKLIEIDKIKMLFLNDNQRKLFEYLPQPKIFSSQEEEDKSSSDKVDILFSRNKSVIDKAEDAWEALKQMRSQNHIQTIVDKKLLEMIDPTFLDLFQETEILPDTIEQLNIRKKSSPVPSKSKEPERDSFGNIQQTNKMFLNDRHKHAKTYVTSKQSDCILSDEQDASKDALEDFFVNQSSQKKIFDILVPDSKLQIQSLRPIQPSLLSEVTESLPDDPSQNEMIGGHINPTTIQFAIHADKVLSKIKKSSQSSVLNDQQSYPEDSIAKLNITRDYN